MHYEIQEPANKHLLILVHGLNGSVNSWKGSQEHFVETLSKEDLIQAHFDVALFTYKTSIISFQRLKKIRNTLLAILKNQPQENIDGFNVSITLIARVFESRIRTEHDKYNSISIVAHSMGGLITKSALLRMPVEIREKVRLFISLSVPHIGAQLAKVASTLIGSNPQLRDLQAFGSFTTILNEDYSNAGSMPTLIYQSGHQDIIVSRQSAIPTNVLTINTISTEDDHSSVLLIKDRNSNQVFQRLLKELELLLSRSPASVEAKVHTSASEQTTIAKISVTRVSKQAPGTDYILYDLLTLVVLNQVTPTVIFGHEPSLKGYQLKDVLNNAERLVAQNIPSRRKRDWTECNINDDTILADLMSQISDLVNNAPTEVLGVIFKCEQFNNEFTKFINAFYISFQSIHTTSDIHFIIECPTRNVDRLKDFSTQLDCLSEPDIFISTDLLITDDAEQAKKSFFKQSSANENIFKFIEFELFALENDFASVSASIPSLQHLKNQFTDLNTSELFSIKGMLDEFSCMLDNTYPDNKEWAAFYTELIDACNLFAPQWIEQLFFYSADCSNPLIRFKPLQYAIDTQKEYLIDYWIEGSRIDEKNYLQMTKYLEAPALYLLYPLLRYFNRHPQQIGLKEKILHVLNDQLSGRYLDDYWVAEKIIGNKPEISFITPLTDTLTILKLMRAGVNIFDRPAPYNLRQQRSKDEFSDKIIYTTGISVEKIQFILDHHPYLVLNHYA